MSTAVDVDAEKDIHPSAGLQAQSVHEIAYAQGHETDLKVDWFRGTTTQAIITGIASFLAPGAYAALAATGGGGLANVDIGNASTAVAYALIVPSALVSTAFLSKVGPRWTLALGACGYAPYAAALYANSAFANQWGLIVGAIVCGATSGLFWVAEGVIISVYSEPHRKGRMLAIWQSLYTVATTVGGFINLFLNLNVNVAGGLKPKTYLVFVALNCIAPFVSLLLSKPSQVQRKDGLPVTGLPDKGFWTEVWLTCKELKDPRVLACSILWSQALFMPSWASTYRAKHFSVRARGMSSVVIPVITICWFQIMAFVLDSKKISVRRKVMYTWGVLEFVIVASITWLLVLTAHQSKATTTPFWDWATPGFAAAWIPSILATAAQGTAYGYMYYMAGYAFPRGADSAQLSRIIATLRSAESGSAAIAFGVNSTTLGLYKVGWINMVFALVTIPCGLYVINFVWRQDKLGMYDDTTPSEQKEAIPPQDL